jgi:6-phosphofructokinase
VKQVVDDVGHCVVAASEGIRDAGGKLLAASGSKDSFGHPQLGGVAPLLADSVQSALGFKVHWAVPDYLQRSARHLASRVDVQQAMKVGEGAVRLALGGANAVMATIERVSDTPYRWRTGSVPLSEVANRERRLPRNYITGDGWHITPACRRYLAPLIRGEDMPPFRGGLPVPLLLKNFSVPRRLETSFTP